MEGVVLNPQRNEAILALCFREVRRGRKVLILVNRIKHGRILTKSITSWFGCRDHVAFVWSNTPSSVKEEIVCKFRSGEISVVVASPVFGEGTDIPEIDCLIVASGGQARIPNIQRIGRGMRPGGLQVYDFWDVHHDVLLRHSRKRWKDYKSLGVCVMETRRLEEIVRNDLDSQGSANTQQVSEERFDGVSAFDS